MTELVVIVHDIRSAYNVGSILRTAEGMGVAKVYLTGYTPYPKLEKDERLPHLANKLDKQIKKSSLGAESMLDIESQADIFSLIAELKNDGFKIAALEQSGRSINIYEYKPRPKLALIVGSEVSGLSNEVLSLSEQLVEIPMLGKKESFNVSVALGMALFYIRGHDII